MGWLTNADLGAGPESGDNSDSFFLAFVPQILRLAEGSEAVAVCAYIPGRRTLA